MISLNWTKDYIDIADQDPTELALKITKAGVNIEKVVTHNINNLVIGQIVECYKHPNSDHLNVCHVNVGDEVLQIVCGADNVRKDLKVIVSKIGAVLPGDFTIEKSVLRGVESCGMICALYELGLEEKTKENYDKGIHELPDDAPVGEEALSYLGYDDTLYELDVHKHRNNDCYYHIGFAYEIGTILNRKVNLPIDTYKSDKETISDKITLKVDTDKCSYYSCKVARNVTIKESPDFIKKRLASYGMRSINNVVDISNYVMLEYGQPLHFFDYNKLGCNILVRDAKDGENIITLDDEERILNSSDIVITDGDKPVAIAGVMGGANTDVDDSTKDILIESAIFDAINIRNTANRLDLRSEASIRYGKGLNFEYTKKALDRACYLLEKYADATILSGEVVFDKVDKTPKVVTFRACDINKILGITLNSEDVKEELDRLDFSYEIKDDVFTVTIPNRRLDIDPNINDIAEEVGRLYGYHNLKSTLPVLSVKQGKYVGDVKLRKVISKRLRSLGLNECKTYTLTSPSMASTFKYEDKENLVLPNPMSVDKSVIRTSILPSLFSVYEYNKYRNVKDVLIYEISKTYDKDYVEDSKIAILIKGKYLNNSWNGDNVNCNFYTLKGIIENLLNFLGFNNRYSFTPYKINDLHPGMSARIMFGKDVLGVIGRVHPNISKDDIFVAEISLSKLYNAKAGKLKYQEVSKYPDIVKDVAFIIDKKVLASDVLTEIRRNGSKILKNIEIFDVYEGEKIGDNKKSIAYSLTFNDKDRTLNEGEVDQVFRTIIKKVTNRFKCEIRDK